MDGYALRLISYILIKYLKIALRQAKKTQKKKLTFTPTATSLAMLYRENIKMPINSGLFVLLHCRNHIHIDITTEQNVINTKFSINVTNITVVQQDKM